MADLQYQQLVEELEKRELNKIYELSHLILKDLSPALPLAIVIMKTLGFKGKEVLIDEQALSRSVWESFRFLEYVESPEDQAKIKEGCLTEPWRFFDKEVFYRGKVNIGNLEVAYHLGGYGYTLAGDSEPYEDVYASSYVVIKDSSPGSDRTIPLRTRNR